MDEEIEFIKKNTQLVIEQLGPLSDIEFGLNRESLGWVEGFIERQRVRSDFDPSNLDNLVNVLGSFLGECILAKTGDEWFWSESERSWAIALPGNTYAFPFTKVHKLFLNGLEGGDSIVSFYDVVVEFLAKGRLSPASQAGQDTPPN